MKTTIQLEFDTPEAAIAALERIRGKAETPKEPAPKLPKAAGTPPSVASAPASTPAAAPTPSPAPSPAPAPAPTPPAESTVPPLQALADLVGQGVNKNRDGTIAVLATFDGAKKASQVPEGKRAEAIAAMQVLLGGDGSDLTG